MAALLAEYAAELAYEIASITGKASQASVVDSIAARLQNALGLGLTVDRAYRQILGEETSTPSRDVPVNQHIDTRIQQMQRHINNAPEIQRQQAVHNAFTGGIGNVSPSTGLRQRVTSEGSHGRRPDIFIDIPLSDPEEETKQPLMDRLPQPRRPGSSRIPIRTFKKGIIGAGAAGIVGAGVLTSTLDDPLTTVRNRPVTQPVDIPSTSSNPTYNVHENDPQTVERMPRPIHRKPNNPPLQTIPEDEPSQSNDPNDTYSSIFPSHDPSYMGSQMLSTLPDTGIRGKYKYPKGVYLPENSDPYSQAMIHLMTS